MTGQVQRVDYAEVLGRLQGRIEILEAVRNDAAGADLIGYEYTGLDDSNFGDLVANDLATGSSFACIAGGGTPDGPIVPPVGAFVAGTARYIVTEQDDWNSATGVGAITLRGNWQQPTEEFCAANVGAEVGTLRVTRLESAFDTPYGGVAPSVEFGLILARDGSMSPNAMYDGTQMWGGFDGAGSFPQYTLVPWPWQDGDEIQAHWHYFTSDDCGD